MSDKLRAGEHAAMQARQRDPLGAAARQAERLQPLLAALQMVDQRDRRWSGASRFMRVPASRSRTDSVVVISAGEGVTASRNRESALGGVKSRPRAIRPEPSGAVAK